MPHVNRCQLHPSAWTLRALGVASFLALALVASAAASSVASARSTSKELIAIHQRGVIPVSSSRAVRGKYSIDLKASPFGPTGTTLIYLSPGTVAYVNGQERFPFSGTDYLTSSKGKLDISFDGVHTDVNSRLYAGQPVGPAIEYGTWKVSSATGIYRGWKGGGNWAAALWGYGAVSQYSVEWDGYVSS